METIIHTGVPAQPSELNSYQPQRESKRLDPDDGDHKLRDLVAFMARGLVDHPDEVAVEVLETGADACFELQVHPDDLGHVIGKQGRTARSLRLTLGAAAQKLGRRANLEIAD
jgi:predicted RNA-binding protein YlqC (UPF0109 family)